MKYLSFLLVLFFISSSCKKDIEKSKSYSIKVEYRGYIFESNENFKSCHASSIAMTEAGNLIAVWFGGTSEGNNDVGIWMSKGNENNWTQPIEIAKINDLPHWNPVLFVSEDGTVHLFFKVGPSPSQWATWHQSSNDNGESWSMPVELVNNSSVPRGPVRCKPIILSNGDWIAGTSDESDGEWNVFVDKSEDKGKTWSATEFIPIDKNQITDRGVIQPTLWESDPGKVHMMTRSTEDYIFRSDSEDFGKTWSKLYKTSLPNNNAGIDVTKMKKMNGLLVLAFNNLPTDGIRTPINLGISDDNGKTWNQIIELENNAGSEFSYPSIISKGNKVFGTYTWNRKRIAFYVAEIEEIQE